MKLHFLSKTILLATITISTFLQAGKPTWDWSQIDTSDLHFPSTFLWGVASSEYQNSGSYHCPNCNWAHWEKNKPVKAGKACDSWNRSEIDIQLTQELGVNATRFSVEWSNIEPEEGVFDEDALQHYETIVDEYISRGITPMITLHHFTDPLWFSKKGGFEKEKNIRYFVRFCTKVFERLGHKVHLWCTINEPNIYMFMGYILGHFPPERHNPHLALKVMKHLLKAHVVTYTKLKKMPHGNEAQIGLVHQYLVFEPYTSWNLIERFPGLFFNKMVHNSIIEFLKTGKYRVSLIPGILSVSYTVPKQKKRMDFIGLNYYSRPVIKNQWSITYPVIPSCYPGEIMTDMPFAIYAEGLYNAIKDTASLNIPMYITENGIADKIDDRRELFIKQYLYAVSKAIQEGYDVRGYFYWSLLDNFEWNMGYEQKFGLYEVNLDTLERTLRKGANYYHNVIYNWRLQQL